MQLSWYQNIMKILQIRYCPKEAPPSTIIFFYEFQNCHMKVHVVDNAIPFATRFRFLSNLHLIDVPFRFKIFDYIVSEGPGERYDNWIVGSSCNPNMWRCRPNLGLVFRVVHGRKNMLESIYYSSEFLSHTCDRNESTWFYSGVQRFIASWKSAFAISAWDGSGTLFSKRGCVSPSRTLPDYECPLGMNFSFHCRDSEAAFRKFKEESWGQNKIP